SVAPPPPRSSRWTTARLPGNRGTRGGTGGQPSWQGPRNLEASGTGNPPILQILAHPHPASPRAFCFPFLHYTCVSFGPLPWSSTMTILRLVGIAFVSVVAGTARAEPFPIKPVPTPDLPSGSYVAFDLIHTLQIAAVVGVVLAIL